jgi:hypothetical protein
MHEAVLDAVGDPAACGADAAVERGDGRRLIVRALMVTKAACLEPTC